MIPPADASRAAAAAPTTRANAADLKPPSQHFLASGLCGCRTLCFLRVRIDPLALAAQVHSPAGGISRIDPNGNSSCEPLARLRLRLTGA
jgi:hypothetical protein